MGSMACRNRHMPEECEPDSDMLDCIALLLDTAVSVSDGYEPTPQPSVLLFHQDVLPKVTVREYMHRLVYYMHLSDWALVMMVHYMTKILQNTPSLSVSAWTVHRLVGTVAMLTYKFHSEDHGAKNTSMKYISRILGVPLKDTLAMEWLGVEALQYRLYVSPAVAEAMRVEILEQAERQRGV
jgi:hypothetical protein